VDLKGVFEGDGPSENNQYEHSGGHDAQAAKLDEGKDDALPKAGPVGACVLDYQAGDAYGGGGGEEGVQQVQVAAWRAGLGQGQEECADKDQKGKTDDDAHDADGAGPGEGLGAKLEDPGQGSIDTQHADYAQVGVAGARYLRGVRTVGRVGGWLSQNGSLRV